MFKIYVLTIHFSIKLSTSLKFLKCHSCVNLGNVSLSKEKSTFSSAQKNWKMQLRSVNSIVLKNILYRYFSIISAQVSILRKYNARHKGCHYSPLECPFFTQDAPWSRGTDILFWDVFFPSLGHPGLGVLFLSPV